jgi:hypothetical protein
MKKLGVKKIKNHCISMEKANSTKTHYILTALLQYSTLHSNQTIMPMSTNNNKKRKASDDQQVVVDVDDDGDRDRDRGGRGAASATSIEDLVAKMLEYTRKADIRANRAEIRQEKAEKRATRVESLLEKLVKNTNAIINNSNVFETVKGASSAGSTTNNQEQQQQQLLRLAQKGNSNNHNDELSDDEVQIVVGNSAKAKTKENWNLMFKELRKYRIKNGHCKASRTKDDPKLAQWVKRQREAHATLDGKTHCNSKITPEQIIKLDSLSFWWGIKHPTQPSWHESYEQLKKYQQSIGNCNVPMNKPGVRTTPLAKWVSYQRSEFKYYTKGRDSLLTIKQIDKLTKLGFDWNGKLVDQTQTPKKQHKLKTQTNAANNIISTTQTKTSVVYNVITSATSQKKHHESMEL